MKDRGNIKWTSMMLPEHKKRLSDLYKQQFHSSKPDLDEQKIEELNHNICLALNDERQYKITFHQNHTYHSVTGRIENGNFINKTLRIVIGSNTVYDVPLEDITNIEVQ